MGCKISEFRIIIEGNARRTTEAENRTSKTEDELEKAKKEVN